MNENLKILVVDDEEAIRNIFKKYLEATDNYTVSTARDGLEALDIIKRERINCCFTDISMPRLDGVALTEKIHAYDNTIPVIVMTGYPTMDNTINTLKNGAVDFLTKPIKIEEVPSTIERVLQERSLFVDNILFKEKNERNEKLLEINHIWQQKMKEVETMNLIFERLDQTTTSKDLFHTLVKLSGEITACDEAHFYIFGQDMTCPAIVNSFFKDKNEVVAGARSTEENLVKKAVDDGMPLLVRKNDDGNSIMAIPLKVRSRIFGVLTSLMRNGRGSFTEKDLYFLNFLAEKASFLIENVALYENIYENLLSIHYAFVETIEARDPYTKQHSTRVTNYALSLGKALGCSQGDMEALNISGTLHDIGKIGIPDNILSKPDRLTDEEYRVIKKHPIIGNNIIGHFNMWAHPQKIIKHHHERWDGNGYPDGLKGEEIPFLSRVLSVADVYDALTSDRSYREKLSEGVAAKIIQENAGGQFDQDIVTTFLKLYGQGKLGG